MPVLLKLLPVHADAGVSVRFKREYLLLQSLNVAGIAKPLAFIDERGSLALILKDFSGESLETVLGRALRLSLPDCLTIARDLADALAGFTAPRGTPLPIPPAQNV